jgi:hypothetical protein
MGGRSVPESMNCIGNLNVRFGASPSIDLMTIAISYLFAAATGIPCDDSYHFIHAVRSSADFFATGDKDFKSYKEESKEENLTKMRELLAKHNPIGYIPTADIITEISRISKLNWAKMIRNPTDVPIMIKL